MMATELEVHTEHARYRCSLRSGQDHRRLTPLYYSSMSTTERLTLTDTQLSSKRIRTITTRAEHCKDEDSRCSVLGARFLEDA